MADVYASFRRCASRPDLMPLHDNIVYGPIRSRRLGASLGLNILPAALKVCDFNCVYCQYGWTAPVRPADLPSLPWPSPADVAAALSGALAGVEGARPSLDRLTLAGHGEPTLHPHFGDVVDAILAARDVHAPGLPVTVLSNSTTAIDPACRATLSRLDERYMKLDAGDADTFRRVNASAVDVSAIVDALAALPAIVIQAMFVRDPQGRIDNTTPSAVDAWLAAVARIRPSAVHLYTLARSPAWTAIEPVAPEALADIAARVTALGIEADVFA